MGQKQVAYTGLSENTEPETCDKIEEKIKDALERNPSGVVVTLGTDAMEQIARRLDNEKMRELLVRKNSKLILTAANDDISNPQTDAWNNLEFALDCASGDAPSGVYVAFHQRLIPAEKVVKRPFDNNDTDMDYVALDDPEYSDAQQKQQERNARLIAALEAKFGEQSPAEGIIEYPVNSIRQNHDELIDYISAHSVRAVLLTLYHSGTANTENPQMSVSALVEKLRKDKGIVFFGATENGEPVNLRAYETSVKLRQAGVVPLYDMPKEVALAKLRLIDASAGPAQLITDMLTQKVGEIDETMVIDEDIDALQKLYKEN